MSCWRYTPTPKQDRLQDLLEAICPDFLHTTLTKQNSHRCYSNIPQLLSTEVVLCMHKTTILCQFGLFCHQLTTISPSILNHFWWELYQGSNRKISISMIFPLVSCCNCINNPTSSLKRLNCLYLALGVIR